MDKGPFSIYDFIGYALPGAFTISLIQLYNFDVIQEILDVIYKQSKGMTSIYIISFVIISYVLGHLINFLSSLTVETLTIWLYGYPSSFLLKKPEKYRYLKTKYMSGKIYKLKFLFIVKRRIGVDTAIFVFFQKKYNYYNLIVKYFMRVLLWVFLFPISFMSLIFGRFLRTNNLILKPMGSAYWKTLKVQWQRYIGISGFVHLDQDHPERYYRIITDFVYETSPIHAKKMDNYVALYGFLRTLSFILNMVCIYLLTIYIYETFFLGKIENHSLSFFYYRQLLIIFGLSFVSYIFFIAYLKFYRRYTLEGFSGFMTNSNLFD